MGWSRVGNSKIEHRYHARIDIVDTVEKHVVGVGNEPIDFLQFVHTREAKRRTCQGSVEWLGKRMEEGGADGREESTAFIAVA